MNQGREDLIRRIKARTKTPYQPMERVWCWIDGGLCIDRKAYISCANCSGERSMTRIRQIREASGESEVWVQGAISTH